MTPRPHLPRRTLATLCTLAASLVVLGAAPPSVGWRHDGTGRYPSAVAPPAWSLPSGHHVRWRTPLPAWANSSPIVIGDRVFVTTEPSTLLAVSADSGRILWQDGLTLTEALPPDQASNARALIAEGKAAEATLREVQREQRALSRKLRKPVPAADRNALHARLTALDQKQSALRATIERAERYWTRPRNDTIGYAAATPVSDGAHVFSVYGTGVVAAHSVKGKRRWLRWLGEPHRPMRGNAYGHAASPLLVDGQLIVPMGSLQALDPATGVTRWRAGVYADFGSPVAVDVRGTPAVATPRGLVHRASDGELLADVGANTLYVGPVADAEHVYWVGSTVAADTTVGGNYETWAMAVPTAALDAGGRAVTPRWRVSLGANAVYATPATRGGLLYVVDRGGLLTILDGRTGQKTGSYDLATGMISASPVLAGGAIYLFAEDGGVVIGPAERAFDFGARARTEGGRATPFAAGGRLFVRSDTSLMSLGAP